MVQAPPLNQRSLILYGVRHGEVGNDFGPTIAGRKHHEKMSECKPMADSYIAKEAAGVQGLLEALVSLCLTSPSDTRVVVVRFLDELDWTAAFRTFLDYWH